MALAQAGGKNLAMRQVRIINYPSTSTRETELDVRAVQSCHRIFKSEGKGSARRVVHILIAASGRFVVLSLQVLDDAGEITCGMIVDKEVGNSIRASGGLTLNM